MTVSEALRAALKGVSHELQDSATVALAIRIASVIDTEADAKLIGDLSAKLLSVLSALGMTPAARNSVVRGAGSDAPRAADALTELRDRKEARTRLHAAPPIHPPA